LLRILIILPHYLPGYKAGGPIRSIANVVSWLGTEFDFKVITTDRDLDDANPYSGIEVNCWQTVQDAKVLYLSPDKLGMYNWRRLLAENDYDLLYLNSFFSKLTSRILTLRRLGYLPRKPVLLAPRGEFSAGALGLKSNKKRLYIWLMKQLGFYQDIYWQASSAFEKTDVLRVMGKVIQEQSRIKIAPNLAPKELAVSSERPKKETGYLKALFLSRITPKKNLNYAIEQMARIKKQILFDIYGPIEDGAYWHSCRQLIERTPDNVKVRYCGEVQPDQIGEIFSQYHLFIFPTLGENFGHVILESLRAGCPILTSERTPWQDLAEEKAGHVVPLADSNTFLSVLDNFIEMNMEQFQMWSEGARILGQKRACDPTVIEANRRMFLDILMVDRS
jgi:glycosyltransferase involved in cell wall biosynthesis